MRVCGLLGVVLLAVSCGGAAPPGPPPVPAVAAPERDAWWNGAVQRPSGKERILAPRELRALLEQGRGHGFQGDPAWWQPRSVWAYERILALDPDDVEANEGVGRITLQALPDFAALWPRLEEARVQNGAIEELLDRFGAEVREGRPVFLYRDEAESVKARLREAAEHLARLDGDPGYAAEQRALAFVRSSHHGAFPYFHVRRGPFLVFYAARDLQTISGEDEASERKRVEERQETYRRRLDLWLAVYDQLLADVAGLYPAFARDHPLAPDTLFCQWIFQEAAWYADFRVHVGWDDEVPPYRSGFFQRSTGWAYMLEPSESGAADDPMGLKETAAYLAALQLLHHWGKDPADPFVNHMERSEDLWFKDGWPSFVASRRVSAPQVGRVLRNVGDAFPELIRIVERRSRERAEVFVIDPTVDPPAPPPDGGYTDLAWLLVRYLHRPGAGDAFERFLRAEVEGKGRGVGFFEECFGVKGGEGWRGLERAVQGSLD